MAGAREVRIVGHDDPWEVLCETETTMVLVNRVARDRRDLATLERDLAQARERLAARVTSATDVSGNPLTGP